MTPAQLQTLKTDIAADSALNAQPQNSDGAFAIATAYNLQSVPDFTAWKSSVDSQAIMENGFVWTAVDALAVGKARIWDWMTRYGSFNPAKTNVRQGLVDAFGAGTAMATAIAPHLKRLVTRAERLFATGNGTIASPGTLTFEGVLSYQDVQTARELP